MDLLVPGLLFLCLLVALPIGMLVAMRLATRHTARAAEQAQAELMRAMQSAVPVEAEVVSLRTLETSDTGDIRVARLTLRVSPPEGQPYTAYTTWEIDLSAAGRLAPGQTIAARVAPGDPSLVYPNVPWARPVVWK